MKKRQGSIRRSTTEAPDAQRWWDRAYQQLLQGSTPSLFLSTKESRHQEGSGSVEQDSSPIFIGAMKKEERTRLMHDH